MDNCTTAANVTCRNDSDPEGTTSVWNTTLDNTTIYYKSKSYMLQEQMNRVQILICPALFSVGLLGNFCVILTISHAKYRQMTSRYILCALAFSDSVLLLANPFNQPFMQTIWPYGDIRAISEIGCKTFYVIYRTAKSTSSWCVVFIAVERFIAVIFPMKAKIIITRRSMLAALTSMYLILIVVHTIRSIFTGIANGKCCHDRVTAETKELIKVSNIIGATLYAIAPMCILLSVTPPVIVALVRSHRMRQMITQGTNERSARDTTRISFMLIGVVVSYIIWVTPFTFTVIIATATNQHVFGSKMELLIILQGIALTFEQLNHSCNFIIYIMFSKEFRRRFLDMIYCERIYICCPDTPTTSPSTTSIYTVE